MKLAIQSMNGNAAFGMENATVTMKNWNNTSARMQSMRRSGNTKKKTLNYNSREISSQLMRASKSRSAGTVLTKAKSKVAMLQRCKGSGQYNDSEVEIAFAHAKRMVKCAQLKMGNLKQEEVLKKTYEREVKCNEQQKKNEIKRRTAQKENEMRQKAAMKEMQLTIREKEFQRELTRKRRMHRDQEHSKIVEAEMKYLQDQMNRNDSSNGSGMGVSLDISSAAINMNELQLSEHALQLLEMQIETEVEMEVSMETASLDTSMIDVTEGSGLSAGATALAGASMSAAGTAINICV